MWSSSFSLSISIDCVVLNRGNHEDFAICSVYGFQLECYEKYDAVTFSLFVEVFQVSDNFVFSPYFYRIIIV